MLERLALPSGQMDPLALREKEYPAPGLEQTPVGTELACSVGLADCLAAAQATPALGGTRSMEGRSQKPHQKRRVGLALAMHGMGYGPVIPDVAGAKLELTPDGRIRVYCGVVDMGQGNASTYLQMAAHLLNQDLARKWSRCCRIPTVTLPSGSASASRTTFTYGNALIGAAGKLEKIGSWTGPQICWGRQRAENLRLVRRAGSPPFRRKQPVFPWWRLRQDHGAEEQRFAEDTYQSPMSGERPSARMKCF